MAYLRFVNLSRVALGAPKPKTGVAGRINYESVDYQDVNPMKLWFTQKLRALRSDKQGVTIIEYALLAALIRVALVTALGTLQGKISTEFLTIGADM